MTTHDNDDDLQSLWQQPQEIDVSALVDQVVHMRKKTFRILFLDIVGNILALGFVIYLYAMGAFGKMFWVPIAFTVITIAYLAWVISWRRGLWQAAGSSVRDLLHRMRKHAELDIKVARSFSWGVPLGCLTGGIFYVFVRNDLEPVMDLSKLVSFMILAALIVFMVGMMLWGIFKEKSAKKEIIRIDGLLSELNDQDSTE